jgi:hypothetical protein
MKTKTHTKPEGQRLLPAATLLGVFFKVVILCGIFVSALFPITRPSINSPVPFGKTISSQWRYYALEQTITTNTLSRLAMNPISPVLNVPIFTNQQSLGI